MAADLSNLKLAQEVLTTMRGTGRAPFRAGFARPRFGRSGRALNFVCQERGNVEHCARSACLKKKQEVGLPDQVGALQKPPEENQGL